jgi:glycosyltransferase involved in cell wall biosynthesis
VLKNLLFVIDTLGSGGAQTQITNLANASISNGFSTFMVILDLNDNTPHCKLDQRVTVLYPGSNNTFSRINTIVATIIKYNIDAVIAFLYKPCFYACLSKAFLHKKKIVLIAGERGSRFSNASIVHSILLKSLYIFADHVIANSFDHTRYLKKFPWLTKKTHCIYNGYLIKSFEPRIKSNPCLRIVCVGRICQLKNVKNTILAIKHCTSILGLKLELTWVGRVQAGSQDYFNECCDLLARNSICHLWHWAGEVKDVTDYIVQSDLLMHLSYHEGLPNSVCEAFIHSRPVLLSDVCEHPYLAANGKRGFTCDHTSPENIALGIANFYRLDNSQRLAMSLECNKFAASNLDQLNISREYWSLI